MTTPNDLRAIYILLVAVFAFGALNTSLLVVSLALPSEASEPPSDAQDLEDILSYHGEHLEDSTIQVIMDWHFRNAPMCVDPD